jgi:hypothetical protein
VLLTMIILYMEVIYVKGRYYHFLASSVEELRWQLSQLICCRWSSESWCYFSSLLIYIYIYIYISFWKSKNMVGQIIIGPPALFWRTNDDFPWSHASDANMQITSERQPDTQQWWQMNTNNNRISKRVHVPKVNG